MFSSRGWMRLALIFNLLGTALLYLSFQATSSTVKIMTDSRGFTAICMNQTAVIVTGLNGSALFGGGFCKPGPESKPIALVTIERPLLIYTGFAILLAGFLIQLLAIPSPKSLAQMRAEVKAEEKRQKLAKRLAASQSNDHPTT